MAVCCTERVAICVRSVVAVGALTRKDGDCGIDKGHKRGESRIGVVVDGSQSRVKIKLQRVDLGRRNVCHRQSGDETKIGCGVIWLETVRNDISFVETKTISNSGWDQVHDLTCGSWCIDNKRIVQTLVETDLNESRVLRLRWDTSLRLNHLWHVGWNTGDG